MQPPLLVSVCKQIIMCRWQSATNTNSMLTIDYFILVHRAHVFYLNKLFFQVFQLFGVLLPDIYWDSKCADEAYCAAASAKTEF